MYKWKLAIRFFMHRPTSWLAAAAVALCVFIVLVVLTVMNGLAADFKEKNHLFVGDCVITTESLTGFPEDPQFIEKLRDLGFVQAVSTSIYGVGLITQPGEDWNQGTFFLGVDPVMHSKATGFAQTLHYRRSSPEKAFVPEYAPERDGCVVGIDRIIPRSSEGQYYFPEQLSPIRLVLSSFPLSPKGGLARGGTDLVSSKTYYVSDISQTGLPRVDESMIYLPIEEARLLTGMDSPVDRISSIHIKFAPGVSLAWGVRQIRRLWNDHLAGRPDHPYGYLLEPVRVQSWIENRSSRIAAIEKEQTMLIMLFLMLGVIVVFIIFVIFYMLVGHKSRDIGILKSVGASSMGTAALFLNFAMLIGITGTVIGIAAGSVFLMNINAIEDVVFRTFDFRLWDRSIYAIGLIPNEISGSIIFGVSVSAIGACLLGALLPAFQAARKQPVQVLQVSQV